MFGLDGEKVLGLGLKLKVWAVIVAAAVAIVAASFGTGYGFGHGSGKVAGMKEVQGEFDKFKDGVEKERAAAAKLLADANAKYRKLEQDNAAEVAQIRADLARQLAEQHAADTRAVADLRSGNDRLRFQVRSCQAGPAQADGAPGGVDGQAYAELAPETAATLYSIAADGDAAITEHNALIDWAHSAMKTCGVQTPPKGK